MQEFIRKHVLRAKSLDEVSNILQMAENITEFFSRLQLERGKFTNYIYRTKNMI